MKTNIKTHKQEINGITMRAYNDSNVSWVVSCNKPVSPQTFDKRKFTMKKAMELYYYLLADEYKEAT